MVHCVAMDTQVLLWFIVATVAIALAGASLSAFLSLRRRSARYRYYAQEYARQQQEATPRAGLTAEKSAAIRAHAERSARRDWRAGTTQPQPRNPYGTGSPQAVLWYASYQLALHDLVDAQEQAQRVDAGAGRNEPATNP